MLISGRGRGTGTSSDWVASGMGIAATADCFAASAAIEATKTNSATNPLIKAVVSDFDTGQGQNIARDDLREKLSGLKPDEIKVKCIETLAQAGAMVDAKAPNDAAAFKGWLRQISQRVAEAAKEGGGFLGIGGTPVSDKEKATLQEISSALKLAALMIANA